MCDINKTCILRFQPIGDHLPVPPLGLLQTAQAAGQPQPQFQPRNNNYQAPRGSNDYDNGSYEHYNSENFSQRPSYVQQPSNYQNYQHQPQQYQPQQYQPHTPSPRQFQPPGKLSLNRTPDGFSFSFKKV